MKLNKLILLISIIFIFSCKSDNKKILSQKNLIIKSEKNSKSNLKKDTIRTKNNLTLDYLQGIWRSYSYYLEHEQENKDFHKNEYYKVVNDKKSLEITLKKHNPDDIAIQTSILGFLDKKKSNIKISNLNNQGDFFVRIKYLKENIDETRFVQINKHNISHNFESYFDGSKIFDDYFDYHFINDTITEKVTFIKLSSLPKFLYKKLKKQSKKDNRDYIKEFNIKGFSQKIKVTEDKTYFYNDSELKDKRKAFLVKGDIAYLEDNGENYVQVYFDGKVVTAGYLNRNDVEILK